MVSDGFGFYVEDTIRPFGLDALTNAVDFTTRELLFPNEDRCCPSTSCGTCKQAPIKDAHRPRADRPMLIGDGASDRKAALLADVVFAKDALFASWCAERSTSGLPRTGFDHAETDVRTDPFFSS